MISTTGFILLTFFIFLLLLFVFFPRLLYVATLIYHVFRPKKATRKRFKKYSLKQLKEIKAEKKK